MPMEEQCMYKWQKARGHLINRNYFIKKSQACKMVCDSSFNYVSMLLLFC